MQKRLSIETAWLDRVEVYFQHQGRTVETYRVGDDQAFSQRPLASRYFVFDHAFAAGTSDVFIRIETPDPMVVPIYLTSPETFQIRQTQQELSYGVVYGFLLALIAYNAILYLGFRSSRYLLYSLYLAMFVVMNIAYTGHGYRVAVARFGALAAVVQSGPDVSVWRQRPCCSPAGSWI